MPPARLRSGAAYHRQGAARRAALLRVAGVRGQPRRYEAGAVNAAPPKGPLHDNGRPYVERGDAEALRSGEGLPEQPALLRGPRLHCHATEREDRQGPVGEGAGYRVLPAAGLLCEGVGREPHDAVGRRRPGPLVAAHRIARARQTLWGRPPTPAQGGKLGRSEEHTSELQSLMRTSNAVFCLKNKKSHVQLANSII